MTVSDTFMFIGVHCRVAAPRSTCFESSSSVLREGIAEYDDEHDGEEIFSEAAVGEHPGTV